MYPLLQPKDILEIEQTRHIEKGDVVLYAGDEKGRWIAHRVVNIQNSKIYTKGDHNREIDAATLSHEEIIGVVTARWRNGKYMKVYRGYAGITQYFVYKNHMNIRKNMAQILRKLPVPAFLQKKLRQILPVPKEAVFLKDGREKKVLFMGKIAIGTYSEYHQKWQIRFPWYWIYN
jgi:signal peptidase I